MSQILSLFQSFLDKPLPEQAPPFSYWLSGILRKAENGNFLMEFVVRQEMTNPLGLLHGGVQAAMLDDVIGMMVSALDKPNPAVSVNLTVDFLGKAKTGDTVWVESNLVRQGRQIIYIVGEIRNGEGKPIARATSNMLQIQA